MGRINLLNVSIDNLTMNQAIDKILGYIDEKKKAYVVTPNVDHIVKLQNDVEFQQVYNNASLILADGMPLLWASKLFKLPLQEKVSGSDLLPSLCAATVREESTIFLLGGLEGVAELAKSNLELGVPGVKIVGTYSPPFGFENNEKENIKIINIINKLKPNILFVGVGAPKQEKWIYNNLKELDINVALGIGATLDFVAGTVKRAPVWMQKSGLEWFYRLIKEPKRMFKRYLIDDLVFFPLLLKYKLLKHK